MAGYPPQPGNQGQQGQYQQGQYPQGQYSQQPYPQQPYGQPYPPQQQYRPGIPGIVIAGFILAFLCPLIGLILCLVGMGEAKRRNAGVGLATAGIIVAAVIFLLNIVVFVGSKA